MIDRRRLAAVLGMLGSAYDGEIIAAAKQAERLRRDAGATWQQLLDTEAEEHDGEFGRLMDCPALSAWDRQFLISVVGRPDDKLSAKQRAALQRIRAKERLWRTTRRARRTA